MAFRCSAKRWYRSTTWRCTLAQSPAAQRLFSEATQLVEDAIDRALTRCAALDRDEIIAPVDVARTRSSFASSAKDALAAMERMADLHGTTGMMATHPMQRLWRDAHIGARHALLNQFMIDEEYAKVVTNQVRLAPHE